MNRPAAIPGCPPGLEYLTQINQLKVKQQIELLEGKESQLFDRFITYIDCLIILLK